MYSGRRAIFIHFYTPILRSAEATVYDAAMTLRPFLGPSLFRGFVQIFVSRVWEPGNIT